MGQFNDLDIIRIVELSGFQEVNTYIEQGWKLLSVRAESLAEDHQQTIYVLGLPRSKATASESASLQQRELHIGVQSTLHNHESVVERAGDTLASTTLSTSSKPQPQEQGSLASPRANRPPARPITFVSRIPLDEAPTKRRRKTKDSPLPQHEPTEEELRERAAWQEVQETGKPVLLDDKLLIPTGMSARDAIEFLPDEMREQTQAALQHTVSEAFMAAVRRTRQSLSKTAEENAVYEKFNSFPYAAQMAIAENIVRHQFGMPEVEIRELLVRYRR